MIDRKAGGTKLKRWKKWRDEMLADGVRCWGWNTTRGKCGKPAQTFDHLIPQCFGGTDSYSNLRPLCVSCHKAKSRVEQTISAKFPTNAQRRGAIGLLNGR